MANSFATDVTQWQGVDDEPTAGSNNLINSGSVYGKFDVRNIDNAITTLGLIGNDGTITYLDGSYKQAFIKVNAGDRIRMIGSKGNNDTVYSLLKEIPEIVIGRKAEFSSQEGFNSRLILNKDDEADFIVPFDANYICVSTLIRNHVSEPCLFEINGYEMRAIYETIDDNYNLLSKITPLCLKPRFNGIVNANNSISYIDNDSYEQVLFYVNPGDIIEIKANETHDTVITFLRSFHRNIYISASKEEGFTSRITILPLQSSLFIVPSDVKYILLSVKINGIDASPLIFNINGFKLVEEVATNIQKVINLNKNINTCPVGKGIITQGGSYMPEYDGLYTIQKVEPGAYMELTGDFEYLDTVYALLRSPLENKTEVDFSTVDGFTTRLVLKRGGKISFIVPSDAEYFYVNKVIRGKNSLPDIRYNNNSFYSNYDQKFNDYVERNGLLGITAWFYTDSQSYKFIEIPVNSGDKVLIQQNSHDNVVGILKEKSEFIPEGIVPYSNVEGFTTRIVVQPRQVKQITVPSDGRYLVLSTLINGSDSTPVRFQINGKELLNSDYVNIINKTNDRFKGQTCVNDTINQRSASAPLTVVNENGFVFSIYLVGKMSAQEHFGEQRDAVCLSVFPICQPERVEYFNVAVSGISVGDINVVAPYEPNVTLISGGCRCFIHINNKYYYRDFDLSTKTFGSILPVIVENEQLTVDLVKTYLQNAGKDISNIIHVIMTCGIVTHDIYKYTIISTNNSNPIVARSTDNFATMEFVSIVDNPTLFESAIGFIGERMYVTIRNGIGKYLYYTDDFNLWTGLYIDASEVSMQKSNIIEHNGILYIVYSLWKRETPCYVWPGRHNIKIVRFDGTTFFDVDYLENPYGIVYPSIFKWNDIAYIIYSNSYLFRDQDPGNAAAQLPQGKDCLWFARLGELL